MKALFLVEAPFQLLSVYEAIYKFSITEFNIVIRLSKRLDNDKQLNNLVEILFPDHISNIKFIVLTNKFNVYNIVTLLYIMIYVLFKIKNVDYIFIGNYESKFLRILISFITKNKIYLLDDGIKNILIQKIKFNNNINYNFFSMLQLKKYAGQIIVNHNFEFFKKNYINQIYYNKRKTIIFIGIDIVEHKLMKENEYLNLLKLIIREYNLSMIYIPHRLESKKKLERINNINKISVEYINYPIELYFFYKKILPYKIISLFSGALLSLKILYPSISIIALKVDNLQYNDSLMIIYNYLKKYIKVIDIEIK